ncbi:MAG: hypothetical protein J0H66_03400 [Solirubrobacterales bacterium]|nr:hypothetical protein [Solirubrobacterales bacterium]OJU96143.1 MAG: hypothetical protein BGO23_01070 [Solirubrobacterales bacterium 67-14]
MEFDQYHEPPEELSPELRTKARLFASLAEEAEAINWYEQRLSVEPDAEARSIMANAQHEEFKHFAMDLEFLFRRMPVWRQLAEGVLFKDGDIVEHGEAAEAGEDEDGSNQEGSGGSLGIGSLKGAGL